MAAGAVAVLTDAAGRRRPCPPGVPVLVVPDVRAGARARSPPPSTATPSRGLRMLGVTGTSGKTTTTFLCAPACAAAGRATGLIGTVATLIGDADDQDRLHHAGGARAAGAARGHARARRHRRRDGGLEPRAAPWAGSTASASTSPASPTSREDHLDFHADMEDYFAAKALLFDARTRATPWSSSTTSGASALAARSPAPVTVSTTGAAARLAGRRRRRARPTAAPVPRSHGPGATVAAGLRDPGPVQRRQRAAGARVLDAAGRAGRGRRPGVAAAAVPGRMERVDAGQDFLAVVDYSHKPAAVDGALRGAAAADRAAG